MSYLSYLFFQLDGGQVLLKRLLAVRFQQEQDKLNQRPTTHNPTYALLACIATSAQQPTTPRMRFWLALQSPQKSACTS